MSEMTAHWAWPTRDLICDECGYAMDNRRDLVARPVRRIFWCVNDNCQWYEQRFEVQPSDAIKLIRVKV